MWVFLIQKNVPYAKNIRLTLDKLHQGAAFHAFCGD